MRKPKQYGTTVTFSTTIEMYEALRDLANEAEISSSQFIREILAKHLDGYLVTTKGG